MTGVVLTPEEELLVAAMRGVKVPEATLARISWNRALRLAGWHRLLPLVREVLKDEPSVPPEVVVMLRTAAREMTARNLRLQHELDRALAALEAEDIPVVLLKGAALLEEVYSHVGLRPMVDIDLLVPRGDIARGHEAIIALGFEVLRARLDRDDEAWLAIHHHHLPLATPDGSLAIEVHHQLLDDRPAYEVASLWARARRGDRSPAHLLAAPEDLCLHVAVHFAFDRIHRGESSLGQLADLVRIARRWDLDWAAIADRARRFEVADRLFLALNAAAMLGEDLAPPDLVASLAPDTYTAARGEQFLRQRVLQPGPALPLEQLSGGRRRLFPGTGALEHYVRPSDATVPSKARLRARRAAWLSRRLVHELRPASLVRDIRLSRWMLTLDS